MNAKLDELLDEFEGRLFNTKQRIDKGQSDKLKTQEELSAIQTALDRAKLLVSGGRKLVTEDCMDCFVRHGRIVKMTRVDSDTGIDIFECPKCWDRKEIDYKSG